MVIDIRSVGEQAALPFSGNLDLSGLRIWGETVLPNPVAVNGKLSLRHGQVRVDYELGFELSFCCARCLEQTEKPGKLNFTHIVLEGLSEDKAEDAVGAPGGLLDLTELAMGDLSLGFIRPFFCREDCRGICPECGTNLNQAECGCAGKKKVDPRLAVLLDFIQE